MSEKRKEAPYGSLAEVRRPLLLWASVGLVLGLFGMNLEFHVGILVALFELIFLIWSLWFIIWAVLQCIQTKGRAWSPLSVIVAIYLFFFLGGYALERVGDRIVFETLQGRYASAISRLEDGETTDAVCAGFRHGCWVGQGEHFQVAFVHPEFFDKHLGYVFDPDGYYDGLGYKGFYKQREELAGQLVPNAVVSCNVVRRPYYRCWFS